jgi:hypothetical protein
LLIEGRRRTRAVVVADENVTVDVAEANEVVGVLVAIIDTRLVALDTSVDNVLGIALVLRSDEADSSGQGNGNGGDETHLDIRRLGSEGVNSVRVTTTVAQIIKILKCKNVDAQSE